MASRYDDVEFFTDTWKHLPMADWARPCYHCDLQIEMGEVHIYYILCKMNRYFHNKCAKELAREWLSKPNNYLRDKIKQNEGILIEQEENKIQQNGTSIPLKPNLKPKIPIHNRPYDPEKIRKLVIEKLQTRGKKISEIYNTDPNDTSYPTDDNEENFRDQYVWHDKPSVDKYIQDKLELTPDQISEKSDADHYRFYDSVVRVISKLREENVIKDWRDPTPTGGGDGVWRLNELSPDLYDVLINPILKLPSSTYIKKAISEINEDLLIGDDVIEKIISALVSGKSVLLVGPIGSGKTHLARILADSVWKDYSGTEGGYLAETYTATAEWTIRDVIGGITPKIHHDVQSGNKITYEMEKGCVTKTILDNFYESFDTDGNSSYKRIKPEKNKKIYKGTWLVIDEFNRADIDKAFGPLFTAFESKELQIPTLIEQKHHMKIKIPDDYRIIGTLNSADKHYLNHLSDALKRRFSIIEINVPNYEQKESELYIIAKKSNSELREVIEPLEISLSEKILKCDSEVREILEKMHFLMSYLRFIKPVGSALLISMFNNMRVSKKMGKDWEMGLDESFVQFIIPQLENLPSRTLITVQQFVRGRIHEHFSKKFEGGDYENYEKDFTTYIKFLNKVDSQKYDKINPKDYLNESRTSLIDKDKLKSWENLSFKKHPKLPKSNQELLTLLEKKGITEEIEFDNQ